MRTMAQKRAEFALEEVLKAKPTVRDKFPSFTAGAPSMILKNGLGQTLAFWLAKGKAGKEGKTEHIALFEILTKWLRQTDKKNFGECQQPKDYVLKLAKMEQCDYLKNQNETMALLEWVKRFANADLA